MRLLTLYLAVIPIFLTIFFITIRYLEPRVSSIIARLTERTTKEKDIEVKDELDFMRFMSWHQVCHSLESRQHRLNLSMNSSVYVSIVSAVVAGIGLAIICFHIDKPDWLPTVLDGIVSLGLIASLVGIIHPGFFIWNARKIV